jgi:hypothetical protein
MQVVCFLASELERTGFLQGVASVRNGLGNGLESTVMGAADGIVTCREGLTSGVKSTGSGFAFTGDKKNQDTTLHREVPRDLGQETQVFL